MNRQAANKAWWRYTKSYRSKDVSWRERCRRMVEHVCDVLCLGNENWSGSRATMDRIRKWETKAMRRVFRFKKEEYETWANYCTRAARVAKKIAEGMWRAMGWVCNEKAKRGDSHLETGVQMEKHKMVAVHKGSLNEKRRGNTCGRGTTAGVSGTEWLLNGLEMKTGLVGKEKDARQ